MPWQLWKFVHEEKETWSAAWIQCWIQKVRISRTIENQQNNDQHMALFWWDITQLCSGVGHSPEATAQEPPFRKEEEHKNVDRLPTWRLVTILHSRMTSPSPAISSCIVLASSSTELLVTLPWTPPAAHTKVRAETTRQSLGYSSTVPTSNLHRQIHVGTDE